MSLLSYDDDALFVCGECNAAGCKSFCAPRWTANTVFSVSNPCIGSTVRWKRGLWVAWRVLMAVVMLGGLISNLIVNVNSWDQFGRWATKYTIFTFCIETWCAIQLAVNSIVGAAAHFNDAIQSKPAPLSTILFEISAPHSISVVVLFWALLSCGDTCRWTTFIVHGVNAGLFLIDAIFNRIRFVPFHFIFVLAVDLIYLIYASIYQATTGNIIYPGISGFDQLFIPLAFGLPLLNILLFAFFLILSFASTAPGRPEGLGSEGDFELTEKLLK